LRNTVVADILVYSYATVSRD